ncbi:MAG: undecaprenyl-diphosphate phosphatase [Dehalococcoidia bacterium]
MPFFSSFLLGLVQGLTEFLPISSSGHLVLASELLNYRSPGLVLETVVHVATTLVVIIYFRARFLAVIKGAIQDADTRWLILMLGLAFVITAVIGLALSRTPILERMFDSPALTGIMLLITAVALISVRRLRPPEEAVPPLRITWKVALLVGLAQGIAIFPGISRSGFTIVAALWGGLSRNSAAEFSFLLSVPTLIAASLFSLIREPDLSGGDAGGIIVAGVVAFVSGLIAIHWLMRWLRQGRLWWFSGYCAVVGAISLAVWGLNLA